MKRFGPLLAALALLAMSAAPASAYRPGLDGTYVLDYLLVTVTAEVKQGPETFVVVAKVTNIFGQDDTYTFLGNWEGDRVIATHYQGHRFEGRVEDHSGGAKITGTLHTRWGSDFNVTATPREKISENTEVIDRRVRRGEFPFLQKQLSRR
jgi:hypothetical protein